MVDPSVLETFTLATFAAHVDEVFALTLPDGEVLALRLVEAIPVGQAPARGGRTPFSIVFRGPPELALAQGSYRVEHEQIATFDLFLVPIAPDAGGRRYEAVFG